MKRPIAIGLAPNITKEDADIATALLWNPFRYTKGNATRSLEEWFERYFHVPYAIAFSSGRGSLYAILRALGVGKGDEVLVQAFTCAAVIQAIVTTGARPVYVDIDQTLTLNPVSVTRHITKKTKAIIAQHTFGIPANMDALQEIAKRYQLFLVEDVAHTIGGKYNGKLLGTFGVASIFSFGRDKAFSCVSGGMVITSDTRIGETIKKFAKQKGYPPRFWIFQQLFHTVSFYFAILPLYAVFVGKLILVLFQKLHLLSLPVDTSKIILADTDIKKLPPALASLALVQLKRLSSMNAARKKITSLYAKEISYLQSIDFGPEVILLRYPLLVKNAPECIKYFRKRSLYIGNWYSNVVDPHGVSLNKLGYKKGSCPNAEAIAHSIINLPVYPTLTEKEVYTILRILNTYVRG